MRAAAIAPWATTLITPPPADREIRPVHLLAFACATCPAVHHLSCASDAALSTEERRDVLLKLEPAAICDGWSIGVDHDHCPPCAARLGLTTTREP